MTTLANISLIAVGLSEVREGSEIVSSGVVHMAEGIYEAWRSPIRWTYGKGDNEVSGVASLADMFKPRRAPDGSADSKFLPAMYRAVEENFLTDGEFAAAEKVQFKRAWCIAAAKWAGVPVEFVDADVIRKGKRAKVRAVEVPASVAFELYNDQGVPTAAGKVVEADVKRQLKRAKKRNVSDEDMRKLVEETPVECIGGKYDGVPVPATTSIADILAEHAIKAGYMPPKASRATRNDKGVALVDLSDKMLKLLKVGEDEAEVALSNDIERKLKEVANAIAAFIG
jgi:hypothetical protein